MRFSLLSLTVALLTQVAFAGVANISGHAAATLFHALPGKPVEIRRNVFQKTSTDGKIVCYKADYMLGETEYDCAITAE